jgi:hypothetical protein
MNIASWHIQLCMPGCSLKDRLAGFGPTQMPNCFRGEGRAPGQYPAAFAVGLELLHCPAMVLVDGHSAATTQEAPMRADDFVLLVYTLVMPSESVDRCDT